jgi:hypothetical protein
MLRALTAVLSLIFLMHACSSLARNAAQTRRLIYHDTHTVTALPTPGSRRWWEDLLHFIREPWGEPREGFTIEIERIWHAYCVYDRRSYRFLRTGLLTALTLSVAVTGLLIENPPRPCRGSLPCAIDFAITVTAIALVMLLIFFVLDATISCCRWILALRDSRTSWPSPETAQPCLALMPVNAYPLLDDHSDATRTHGITAVWLEIEIAAQRTVVICRLILYPFFVIPLLVLAQFDFFDRWAWPVSLLFVFGLLMVCAVTAALVLRRCAESARISALAEVQRARIQSYTHRQSGRDEACDALLKSIQEETRGAFAPLIQNPVFAAVLLPISGLGTGLAIETMLKGL